METYGNCPYNNGIDCEKKICDKGGKCGWHPLIKEYRKRLLEKNQLPMQPVKKNVDLDNLTPMQKREREKRIKNANYSKERRDKLLSEGRCPVCGKVNDRDGKSLCSACWEREKAQRKLREVCFYDI